MASSMVVSPIYLLDHGEGVRLVREVKRALYVTKENKKIYDFYIDFV